LDFADPSASVVGQLYGRRKVGKGSLEGAAAFFTVAVGVLLVSQGVGAAAMARAVGVAAIVAAIEVLPLGLDDNLTVPLSTGLALQLALLLG
jgi:glycerol-3-phosphate acyltransferase PlsY